jgi:hypothetical protein
VTAPICPRLSIGTIFALYITLHGTIGSIRPSHGALPGRQQPDLSPDRLKRWPSMVWCVERTSFSRDTMEPHRPLRRATKGFAESGSAPALESTACGAGFQCEKRSYF